MDINFEKNVMNNHSRTLSKMATSTRRLNSGYRINSAADDAAGLAVSEKIRSMDKGLQQGLRNISDGRNFLATQDSAEQVINDSLHRLKEIAVEAANGTESRVDREALDLEYQQILDEIGDITSTGDFNGMPLFDQHMPEYSKFAGNIEHKDFIDVATGVNSPLKINYSVNGTTKSISIDIPMGRYTADEIADMIDDQLYEREPSLIIGVNERGQFSLQCEGGHVNFITGPGASLFYERKLGSAGGYMLGVTKFTSDTAKMFVSEGNNDVLEFRIEGDDDTVHQIKLDSGWYTYGGLIDNMNEKFREAGMGDMVKAVPYRDGPYTVIGLSSEKPITGLEGNFLYLGDKFSSPLYDIADYSDFKNTKAELNGVKKLDDDVNILRDRNNYFVFDVRYYADEDKPAEKTVRVDLLDEKENTKKYTKSDLIKRINQQIADAFKDEDLIPVTAKLSKDGCIHLETKQYGKLCKIELNETDVPSEFMLFDLFKTGTQNEVSIKIKDSMYIEASNKAYKNISKVDIDSKHDTLQYTISVEDPDENIHNITLDLKLDPGSYSGSEVVAALNDRLKPAFENELKKLGLEDLKTDVVFVLENNSLKLKANGDEGTAITLINLNTDQNVSTAYRRLIRGVTYSGTSTPIPGDTKTYKKVSNTSNVQYSDGAKAGEDYYTPGYNTPGQRDVGPYLTYKNKDPKPVDGEFDWGNVDVVGNPSGTHATLTFPDALSQFVDKGDGKDAVCLRDTNVRFTLNNAGAPIEVSAEVKAGGTFADLKAAIEKASNNTVTVEKNGSDIVITSTDIGDYMSFTNYGGNLAATAAKASGAGGIIDYDNNTYTIPPSLTLGSAGSSIPIDVSKNNKVVINVGGNVKTITLTPDDNGNGMINSLSALADQINKGLGDAGSAAPSGNGIIIRGGKDTEGDIVFDPSSTCKIDQIFHKSSSTDQPGSALLPDAGKHADLLEGTSGKTLTFDYTIPGEGTKHVEIPINGMQGSGIYALVSALNTNMPEEHKDNITISVYNGGLRITTKGKGAGYSISNVGGTANLDKTVSTANTSGGSIDYKHNQVKFPAEINNYYYGELFYDPGMEIVAGENDIVQITVTDPDGNTQSKAITLDPGIYTSSWDITKQLRDEFGGMVNIYAGSTLSLETKEDGKGASISIDGTTAPIFQKPNRDSAHNRIESRRQKCTLQGNVDVNGIKISDYDNTMKFKFGYSSGGVHKEEEVVVTVPPEDSYTPKELADALQASLDINPGKEQLVVSCDDRGRITIKGATITKDRSISEFEGPLFDKVFRGPYYTKVTDHGETPGTCKGDKSVAFIIGRNHMEPETEDEIESKCNIVIYPEQNDKLTFNMKFYEVTENADGTKTTTERCVEINLTLPAGEYDRKKIAETVQELTRQQLSFPGSPFDPDNFKATIGLAPLGIPEPGNLAETTENTLVLSYKSPDDGSLEYDHIKIEGVRGNLAYRVFYKASETPSPTQVVGAANIANGVVIQSGVNDTFTVGFNGKPITVSLPSGTFSGEEIVHFLNKQYERMGADIRTSIKGDNLMIFSLENGEFNIDPISGSASYDLFYGGESRQDDDSFIGIHSGRRTDSYIWYEKTRLDQHLMRINTTGVTTIDRALKAIARLDNAHSYLLTCRGLNGANENRSARTYERNATLIENLRNSESSLRDTDMAAEISNLQKQQIIQQFQDNLLTQNKETVTDMVLKQLNQRG